jgi:hypothetical protein
MLLGKKEKAIESFETFLDYSDRVTPESFYQKVKNEKYLEELFVRAVRYLDTLRLGGYIIKATDIFPHIPSEAPAIKRYRNLPGFTFGKGKRDKALVSLGIGYYEGDFYGEIGLIKGITDMLDVEARFQGNKEKQYYSIYLPIGVYKSTDNRFGIKLRPRGTLFCENSVRAFLSGIQFSSGYFFTPQLYFYVGYHRPISYWDNSEYSTIVSLLNEHYYFAGIRYYIVSDLGLEANVLNNELCVGIYLFGLLVGYNLNENKFGILTLPYRF